jgi:RNA polymerase sigma-70 factor (ECF subfamily)
MRQVDVDTGMIADTRLRRFRAATLPHLDAAYTLAFTLMGNRADAEDAVEECYLRALRGFDRRKPAAIKPWLFTILRNLCYAAFDRRSGQRAREDPADCRAGTTARALIDVLPLPLREIVVLREFSDLSYREITEVSGVPIATVMSRLAQARAVLRAGMKASAAGSPGDGVAAPPIVYSISKDGMMIRVHCRTACA